VYFILISSSAMRLGSSSPFESLLTSYNIGHCFRESVLISARSN
jgi:hypothetical protein